MFRHPRRALLALWPRISQQVEIASLHQLQAGARQTNGPVAQLVCLPAWTGRNARRAEQSLRDGPISFASKAAVKRTEGKPKPVTSLPGQTIRRTAARSAGGEAPQAQCGIGARGEVRVERDEDRRWRRGARSDEHRGQTSITVANEPIVAVIRGALECRRRQANAARISESLRRRRDENCARIEMR
jgi:hypothetical protein